MKIYNVFISCEHRYFKDKLDKPFYEMFPSDHQLIIGDTILCNGDKWKATKGKIFKMKIENRVIDMINNHIIYECELLLINDV